MHDSIKFKMNYECRSKYGFFITAQFSNLKMFAKLKVTYIPFSQSQISLITLHDQWSYIPTPLCNVNGNFKSYVKIEELCKILFDWSFTPNQKLKVCGSWCKKVEKSVQIMIYDTGWECWSVCLTSTILQSIILGLMNSFGAMIPVS